MIARLRNAASLAVLVALHRWRVALRVPLVAVSVCVAFGASPATAAETTRELERAVKAAFIYKFLSYVEWPGPAFSTPEAPIVIGVHGSPDIADELTSMAAGRMVADRPVVVRSLGERDSLAGLHVLFVGRAQTARLPGLARAAQQHPILVVSESADGLALGSMINLLVSDGRVRFEVFLDSAEKSGLRLSSRLLAVAQAVRTGGGG